MTTARTSAGLAFCALLVTGAREVAADGETTPMFGVAAVGADVSRTGEHDLGLAGVALDVAWWHGRVGIGAEGSARWSIDGEPARATVLGGSARIRVFERKLPSLLDPRDVELALELQAIVERTWWNVAMTELDPTSYGLGLAVRVRGGGDLDGSTRLAESRFFLRVMASRWNELDAVARSTTQPASPMDRSLTVLVGIGASFGAGTRGYVQRFRLRPFEPTLLW